MSEKKHPINHTWKEYYVFLEALRRTGVCNMWGASVYLVEAFRMKEKEADAILLSWIENYDELYQYYGWDE